MNNFGNMYQSWLSSLDSIYDMSVRIIWLWSHIYSHLMNLMNWKLFVVLLPAPIIANTATNCFIFLLFLLVFFYLFWKWFLHYFIFSLTEWKKSTALLFFCFFNSTKSLVRWVKISITSNVQHQLCWSKSLHSLFIPPLSRTRLVCVSLSQFSGFSTIKKITIYRKATSDFNSLETTRNITTRVF